VLKNPYDVPIEQRGASSKNMTALPGHRRSQWERNAIVTQRLILTLLVSCTPLWATTYYVDNCVTVGNDRNNGASPSTPWLTVNKVNTSTFNPGDSILFESTCTWREQLTPPSPGSAGSPITFGAYGTGAAPIISGADLFTSWTPSSGSVYYASYSTAPNQVFEDGARLPRNTVSAASLTAGHWYLDAVNSRIWVYLTAGDSPSGHTMEVSQLVYTLLVRQSYLIFRSLVFTKGNDGNVVVNGAAFVNFPNDESSLGGSSGYTIEGASSYITIQNGSTHDNGGVYDSNGIGIGGFGNASSYVTVTGVDIYGNTRQGVDIALPSNAGQHNSSITMEWCRLHNNGSAGYEVDGGSTALVFAYNLVYGNATLGTSINTGADGSEPEVLVCNNVIYGNGSDNVLHAANYAGGSTIYKNNIIAQGGGQEIDAYPGTNLLSNYNDVYHSAGGTFMSYGGANYTFAGWKTASGQDANSQNADPEFVNAAASQFWLAGGSPAIDAGTNLGSPYNIGLMPRSAWPNSVVTGDQNAYGSGWEIGAYIYVPALAPPTNLQAVAH